ncbi:hypothetical protein BC943DRAFT_348082 [Umbelopsis sp. AD052]|nr:hypothetical protein BC943DRAFT_348082 [Umbelopsis sp. AD052]
MHSQNTTPDASPQLRFRQSSAEVIGKGDLDQQLMTEPATIAEDTSLNLTTDRTQQLAPTNGHAGARRKRQRSPTLSSQTGENTFHQRMEIRVRHSVGSMSISPSSRDIVLAGRQGLLIIDLEDPWLTPRVLPHMSKWEVADVQWSPYIARESWIASTSNQKALIWNLNYSSQHAIEHILHAHSRAISDINWSLHDPNMLATCSVDTYVHLWDMRIIGQDAHSGEEGVAIGDKSIRPESSFCAWTAGATQVKFNRKNQYLLASAHDKAVKIWDIRKGSDPVTTINAHSTKIYGIDWSRQNDHDIVTCSLDKSVKFWNINSPEEAQTTIVTNSPVWRARNTPFGSGVLMMPQRTETTLFLYNREKPEKPVHSFEGHTDIVKEFVWRWKGDPDHAENREFQLVTWSKDQNLRLWPIRPEVMQLVGSHKSDQQAHPTIASKALESNGVYRPHSFQQHPTQDTESGRRPPARSSLKIQTSNRTPGISPLRPTLSGSVSMDANHGKEGAANIYRDQKYAIPPLLWMQNVKTVRPTGEIRNDGTSEDVFQNVAEEMSIILNKFSSAGVRTERVDAASRTCTITLHGPWSDTGSAFLRITITFPSQYPDNTPPEFDIQKNSMISIYYRAHMAQDLSTLASAYTAQKRYCLEPCLRYLLGETPSEDLANLRFGVGNTPGFSPFNTKGSNANNAGSNDHSGFGNWNTSPGANNGDSDDEIYVGSGFGVGSDFGFQNKRVNLQSEKGIVVDMSIKQSADQNVPFPRLCGATFSGNGTLVTFFSTLRVRNSDRSATANDKSKSTTSLSTGANNNSFITNNYSEFYHHPKTYEQFEEYKEIAAMSRQGRNATVLASANSGAFGDYSGYEDVEDDMDEGIHNSSSLYLRPENLEMGSSLNNDESILYSSPKPHHETYHVVLHHPGDLMPFSAELAKAYDLFGDDTMAICNHNAAACKELGYDELYKVWCLAGEILRECVPASASQQSQPMQNRRFNRSQITRSTDVTQNKMFEYAVELKLELTKSSSTKLERRDSGTGLLPLDDSLVKRRHLERITWGLHPLGRQLVDKLMTRFINRGDVQTLAMLSCVFREPLYHGLNKSTSLKAPTTVETLTVTPKLAPSVSHDYFSFRNKNELSRSGSFPALTPWHGQKPNINAESYNSRTEFLAQLPFAADPTPTPLGASITNYNGATDSYIAALDAARNNTAFKLSVPHRLPTNTAPITRNSDDGFLSMLPFISHSWGSTTSGIAHTPETPHGDPLHRSINVGRDGHVMNSEITIEMTNMDAFDGDRLFHHQVPLLDPSKAGEMNTFRIFYADMLYRLGLFEKRAEVLKFVEVQTKDGPSDAVHTLLGGNDPHLDIKVRCRQCHQELVEEPPETSDSQPKHGGYCSTCQRTRHHISCCICHTLVHGLVNFCIRCGHGGHSRHIKEWFVDMQHDVCPTGCGCRCLYETLEYGVPDLTVSTADKAR